MSIWAITEEHDHRRAVAAIDAFFDGNKDDYTPAEIDALITLVDEFERGLWPLDESLDAIQLLRMAMSEEVGHTRHELIGLLGSASRASEILNRQRALTLDMIRNISASWGIPIELLVKPYPIKQVRHMSEEFFIERRTDGRYNIEKPNAQRPSATADTQKAAIERARALDPDATLHVARVRQVGPGRDKWRKLK